MQHLCKAANHRRDENLLSFEMIVAKLSADCFREGHSEQTAASARNGMDIVLQDRSTRFNKQKIRYHMMPNAIDIKQLSRKEKLRVMEAIWEDLSQDEEQVDSPDWHKKALLETEHRLGLGQEKVADLQDARKELGKRSN
jgi:hypothetical protein